jgi:hypothetical protein
MLFDDVSERNGRTNNHNLDPANTEDLRKKKKAHKAKFYKTQKMKYKELLEEVNDVKKLSERLKKLLFSNSAHQSQPNFD